MIPELFGRNTPASTIPATRFQPRLAIPHAQLARHSWLMLELHLLHQPLPLSTKNFARPRFFCWHNRKRTPEGLLARSKQGETGPLFPNQRCACDSGEKRQVFGGHGH